MGDAEKERVRDLSELKNRCEMLTDEARQLLVKLLEKPKNLQGPFTLRPAAEWHDDHGAVLWWHLPVCEPPEVGHGPGAGECNADGTPTICAQQLDSGWLTHWSLLPRPNLMTATDGTSVGGQ